MRVLPVDDVELTIATADMVGVSSASEVTVTVKLAVPTFPEVSQPVQVTVVVPIGNIVLEDGSQLKLVHIPSS